VQEGAGFRVQGAGFRVQGAGFRVQDGAGCRVKGAGFEVEGSGFHEPSSWNPLERLRENLADFKKKHFQESKYLYQDVTCKRSI
jgi:hypothetical protein